MGWKYVEAQEESQRYKVGKFILETKRIRGAVDWEDGDDGMGGGHFDIDHGAKDKRLSMPPEVMRKPRVGHEHEPAVELEFDSQDEDECEDLFAGVWTPELAFKRRSKRFGSGGGNGRGRVPVM